MRRRLSSSHNKLPDHSFSRRHAGLPGRPMAVMRSLLTTRSDLISGRDHSESTTTPTAFVQAAARLPTLTLPNGPRATRRDPNTSHYTPFPRAESHVARQSARISPACANQTRYQRCGFDFTVKVAEQQKVELYIKDVNNPSFEDAPVTGQATVKGFKSKDNKQQQRGGSDGLLLHGSEISSLRWKVDI